MDFEARRTAAVTSSESELLELAVHPEVEVRTEVLYNPHHTTAVVDVLVSAGLRTLETGREDRSLNVDFKAEYNILDRVSIVGRASPEALEQMAREDFYLVDSVAQHPNTAPATLHSIAVGDYEGSDDGYPAQTHVAMHGNATAASLHHLAALVNSHYPTDEELVDSGTDGFQHRVYTGFGLLVAVMLHNETPTDDRNVLNKRFMSVLVTVIGTDAAAGTAESVRAIANAHRNANTAITTAAKSVLRSCPPAA